MVGIPIVVIVIFLVIWIVSNVIRAQQDAAQAAARRNVNRPVQGAAARGPEKTTSSDIDRFLQEIDRLRKKTPQEQPTETASASAPAPIVERLSDMPRSREQPARRVPERKPRPAAERRQPVSLPPPPSLPSLPSLPSAPPPVSMPIVELVTPPLPTIVSQQPPKPAKPVKPLGAAVRHVPPASATIQLVQSLLKNRNAMAAAIVLQEILGKPKSMRR